MTLEELIKEAEDNLTASILERDSLLRQFETLLRIEQNTAEYSTIELIKKAKHSISNELTQCEKFVALQTTYLLKLKEI